MSVNKWAYDPKKCDGDYCVGDCDLCSKATSYCHDDDDCTYCDIYVTTDYKEREK